MESILFIDTSRSGLIEVKLQVNDKIFEASEEQKFGSQVLLQLIKKILKEAGVEKKNLTEIKVNAGPGSFTGIRVGASVANALGFALGIPVNGKKVETDLVYE